MAIFLRLIPKGGYDQSVYSLQYCLGGDRDHHCCPDQQENGHDQDPKAGVDRHHSDRTGTWAIDLLLHRYAEKAGLTGHCHTVMIVIAITIPTTWYSPSIR